MQISERLSFNNKLMDFCLRTIGWSHEGNEFDQLHNYQGCLERTVIAEQIFRSELMRPRPGLPDPSAGDE